MIKSKIKLKIFVIKQVVHPVDKPALVAAMLRRHDQHFPAYIFRF